MDSTISTTKWCRRPIYFATAAFLAIVAITAAINSTVEDRSPTLVLGPRLSHYAIRSLRRAGFSSMAVLLSTLLEFYSSASPNITIFALSNSALSNMPRSPWLMRDFLRCHALPLRLSMADLAEQPERTSLAALSRRNNLVITKTEGKRNRVKINDVPVTHPNLVLDSRVAIHGVTEPLGVLGLQEIGKNSGPHPKELSRCDTYAKVVSNVREPMKLCGREKKRIEWDQVVRFLHSHGSVPFAFGLKSTVNHDRSLRDGKDSDTFTIFAPREFRRVPLDHSILDKLVRAHMISGKHGYLELLALLDKASLGTLAPGLGLEVTVKRVGDHTTGVAVNGVEITDPDAFISEKFIIHGISRVLDMEGHRNASSEHPPS